MKLAYMHTLFFARLANKTYSRANLKDIEVALTVCAYNEDESIADKQTRMTCDELRTQLEIENVDLDWNKMILDMKTMMFELFEGAKESIGEWPNSSAYYSVDVMFDNREGLCNPQPQLIEVNFMGDWDGVRHIACDENEYHQWIEDFLLCLGTRQNIDGHPRLIPLVM